MKEKEINSEPITIVRGNTTITLTDKRLRDLTALFIEKCGAQAELFEDFGMNVKMVDMLLKAKTAWFPATQKNLNLNVESFDKKLELWLKGREELKKLKDNKILIINKNEHQSKTIENR